MGKMRVKEILRLVDLLREEIRHLKYEVDEPKALTFADLEVGERFKFGPNGIEGIKVGHSHRVYVSEGRPFYQGIAMPDYTSEVIRLD